jgi:hypothetical protein
MFALTFALVQIEGGMDSDGPEIKLHTSYHTSRKACKETLLMQVGRRLGAAKTFTEWNKVYAAMLLKETMIEEAADFLKLSFEEKLDFVRDDRYGGDDEGVIIKYTIKEVPATEG